MTDLAGGIDLDAPIDHPLLGRRVKVTLCFAGTRIDMTDPFADDAARLAEGAEPASDAVAVVGVLTHLDAGGSVVVCTDGVDHYCWPALKIEPADEEEQPTPKRRRIAGAARVALLAGMPFAMMLLCWASLIQLDWPAGRATIGAVACSLPYACIAARNLSCPQTWRWLR